MSEQPRRGCACAQCVPADRWLGWRGREIRWGLAVLLQQCLGELGGQGASGVDLAYWECGGKGLPPREASELLT